MNFLWKAAVRAYPFSRGRGRLMHHATRGVSGIVQETDRYGNRLLLDLDNHIDCMIYLQGAYEWESVHSLAKQAELRGCTHFIDVGANLGVYSLFFAKRERMQKLWAFEPDPRNHAQLLANLWVNRVAERVQVSDVALSSTEGPTTFYVQTPKRHAGGYAFNTGTSSLLKAGSQHHTAINIQMRRLDQMVTEKGQNILIKIDVEGAEPMVLEGAQELLKNNRCLVMMEIWTPPMEAVEKMTAYMSGLGYKLVMADTGEHNYLYAND